MLLYGLYSYATNKTDSLNVAPPRGGRRNYFASHPKYITNLSLNINIIAST